MGLRRTCLLVTAVVLVTVGSLPIKKKHPTPKCHKQRMLICDDGDNATAGDPPPPQKDGKPPPPPREEAEAESGHVHHLQVAHGASGGHESEPRRLTERQLVNRTMTVDGWLTKETYDTEMKFIRKMVHRTPTLRKRHRHKITHNETAETKGFWGKYKDDDNSPEAPEPRPRPTEDEEGGEVHPDTEAIEGPAPHIGIFDDGEEGFMMDDSAPHPERHPTANTW